MYNQEELKHCLECRWRIRQIKYYLILFVILFIISIIVSVNYYVTHIDKYESGKNVAMAYFQMVVIFNVIIFCAFLPFIIYLYYDYRKILELSLNASLHKVVLDHPNTSLFYKGHAYFTVSFMTEDKRSITAKTKPIWSYLFSAFTVKRYNNMEVEILYNQEQNRVIVLGLKDWNKNINLK